MSKRIHTYLFSAIILFVLSILNSNAQEVTINAVPEKSIIKPGEPVNIKIDLRHPKDVKVKFPAYQPVDTLGNGFEVVEQYLIDTLSADNDIVLRQIITITGWDSGDYEIAPFKFAMSKGSTIDTIFSNPIEMSVNANLEELNIDENRKKQQEQSGLVTVINEKRKDFDYPKFMKEIYPIIFADLPVYTLKDFFADYYWYFILGILLIIAIVAGVLYYLQWRKNKPEIIIQKPKEAAHVIAFRQLEVLKNKKLWQDDKLKPYYTELTDILRVYIENRYLIQAMEMTTDETVKAISYLGEIKSPEVGLLEQVLSFSDLVKFAKAIPIADENIQSFENVNLFVNNTILVETPQETITN